ncbi:MAG TPA: lysophospholipid acyltransferase family protein [Gemmatimonadota bacterium]|nr:lysophospholipid acyltransferase family protein [Gemmatimonadota bacterium]
MSRRAAELLEYAAARAAEGALSALPEVAGRAAGALAGRAARAAGLRREVALRQVADAFPERDEAWVRATVEACYLHFGREMAALARLSRVDPARLAAATRGTRELTRLLGDGGRIVVTGHLGNWELAGAMLAGLGYPVVAVVKQQANRRFDRRLEALRARLGMETVPMAAAGRRLPGALARGAVVALVADQDALRRGIFVPFLGRPASTFRGPARLALAEDVPLVFGAMVRDEGGYRVVSAPVERPPGGPAAGPEPGEPDAPGPEEALTRAWTARLEEAVRAFPEQYFWFHRRWKTTP